MTRLSSSGNALMALAIALMGCSHESESAVGSERVGVLASDAVANPPAEAWQVTYANPQEYAWVHNTALDASSEGWRSALTNLEVWGDGFSAEHLAQLDRATLSAEQLAVLDTTVAAIDLRLATRPATLRPDDIPLLLERAAYVDLMCDPLEHTLPDWTRALVISQLGDPDLRASVEQLVDGYSPRFVAETWFSSMEKRVPVYAQQILDQAAD